MICFVMFLCRVCFFLLLFLLGLLPWPEPLEYAGGSAFALLFVRRQPKSTAPISNECPRPFESYLTATLSTPKVA